MHDNTELVFPVSEYIMEVPNNKQSPHVVIIGGGISGLSAAFKLHELQPALKITVLEASDRCGGAISTIRQGHFILEEGPDSLLTEKPIALSLITRLGLEDQVIATEKQNNRTYVAWNGKLHVVPQGFIVLAPTNFLAFFASTLFSPLGKLRMALETFLPAKKEVDDESLAAFVRRRFGKEALERVVQPLVGGIYRCDPEKLSLKATMPRFLDLEKRHGSVISGLMKSARRSSKDGTGPFISFSRGLAVLSETIVSRLGSAIRTNTEVCGIKSDTMGFIVETKNSGSIKADGLIIATSSNQASQILSNFDTTISKQLSQITHAQSVVLNLVYKKSDVPKLKGYGFVVSAKEKSHIIACTFASQKYAGRAPKETVVIRVFMGNYLNKDIYSLKDLDLVKSAKEDLKKYLQIFAEPIHIRLTRHEHAAPQYSLGHLTLIDNIQKSVAAHKRLVLAGNYLMGPGIPNCVSSGEAAAESIMKMLTDATFGVSLETTRQGPIMSAR
ncbi:MAG: protoporphyrinogen oxidase [Candidatus Obscuribacterales bacterium]|nr:protoporphyrinogen oxidase [Candidatus Obscuribacterales bacterium]